VVNKLFLSIARQFYKFGWLLLKARLYFGRAASAEDQFSDLWRFSIRHKWLFALKEHYLNPLRIPWENLLVRWLLRIVKSRNPKYKPRIIAHGNELIVDMYKSDRNIVIITIHTALTTSIVRFLEENKVKCSLIVDQEYVAQGTEGDNFGFAGEADLLYRSKDIFLEARRKLRNGRAVVCCVDYLSDKTNHGVCKQYISTAIFDFSKKIGAEVLYALPHISESGCIVIEFSRPLIIINTRSSIDLAQDFISFINSNSRIRKNWIVKKWQGEKY
jgi:hypothetical protein